MLSLPVSRTVTFHKRCAQIHVNNVRGTDSEIANNVKDVAVNGGAPRLRLLHYEDMRFESARKHIEKRYLRDSDLSHLEVRWQACSHGVRNSKSESEG